MAHGHLPSYGTHPSERQLPCLMAASDQTNTKDFSDKNTRLEGIASFAKCRDMMVQAIDREYDKDEYRIADVQWTVTVHVKLEKR